MMRMHISNVPSKLKFNNILPPFGSQNVENWQNTGFSQFSIFSATEVVKCYSIWILRPDLESSQYLASLRTQFDMIFLFWFFYLPCHHLTTNAGGCLTFLKKMLTSKTTSWSVLQNASDRGVRPCIFKKLCKPDHPLLGTPGFSVAFQSHMSVVTRPECWLARRRWPGQNQSRSDEM